ncbi:hypothetical protein [Longibacter sp.]|uniref:hypothetical protein n=1 Tax=Longibacter sp. TaxID=2045415 RepID=UPI003EB9A7FF
MSHTVPAHLGIAAAVALVAVFIIYLFGDATTSEMIGWFVFFAFIQFGVSRAVHARRCERCERSGMTEGV